MRRIQVWLGTNGGRSAGLVLAIALFGFSIVFGWLAMLEPHAGGPGILGLELSGSSRVAGRWVPVYGRDEIYRALGFDLLFILCWSPLLALLALWTGQNYRTVSARRLGVPLATVALGAGALDLLEDLFILLGVGPGGLDPWWTAWQLAAVAAWAKWLAALVVALYAVGGLLSLLLGGAVRAVLRGADVAGDGDDVRPSAEEVQPHWTTGRARLGLAFSGGGIRAASISLGALQSLERGASLGWGSRRPRHLGLRRLLHDRGVERGPDRPRSRVRAAPAAAVGQGRVPARPRGAAPAGQPRLPALELAARLGRGHDRRDDRETLGRDPGAPAPGRGRDRGDRDVPRTRPCSC